MLAVMGESAHVSCGSRTNAIKWAKELAAANGVDLWFREGGGSFELVRQFRRRRIRTVRAKVIPGA